MTNATSARLDGSKMKGLRRPHDIRACTSMRVISMIGIASLLCAVGCKDTSSPSRTVAAQHVKASPDTSSTSTEHTPKVTTPGVSFEPVVSDITDIKHTESTHKHVRKKETTWRDGQGQNRFVINVTRYANEREHETLAILLEMSHSVVEHGKTRHIRTFRERLKHCMTEQSLLRLPKITVTDLDKDGVAEVTWAYSIGCRHKVNDWLTDMLEDEDGEVIKGVEVKGWTLIKGPTKPLKHKVLMTELGKKYAIRGKTKVLKPTSSLKQPGECVSANTGGSKRVDPSFKGAPSSFLTHALEIWKETVEEPITCERGAPG